MFFKFFLSRLSSANIHGFFRYTQHRINTVFDIVIAIAKGINRQFALSNQHPSLICVTVTERCY